MITHNKTLFCGKPKYIPPYASLSGAIINSQWLELTQSLTNVHVSKGF